MVLDLIGTVESQFARLGVSLASFAVVKIFIKNTKTECYRVEPSVGSVLFGSGLERSYRSAPSHWWLLYCRNANMPVENPNVGVAFALVCGAGAATALGASVVFFPALVKLASRRVLAGALGVSAGVMTYVSFVEIFNKSQLSFLDAGHSERDAYLYATLCFFGGVVTMLVSSNRSAYFR